MYTADMVQVACSVVPVPSSETVTVSLGGCTVFRARFSVSGFLCVPGACECRRWWAGYVRYRPRFVTRRGGSGLAGFGHRGQAGRLTTAGGATTLRDRHRPPW